MADRACLRPFLSSGGKDRPASLRDGHAGYRPPALFGVCVPIALRPHYALGHVALVGRIVTHGNT